MLEKITSAYNFVPVQNQVVQPEWQDRVSHDLPLPQGLCAELSIDIQAHTPILVGSARDTANRRAPVQFYTHPDGVPAIPGSALRGMLRNVLEIATHSRLQLLDDRALSLRDLYRDAYTDQFQGKPRAGWLKFQAETGQWQISECDVFSIEQRELNRIPVQQADGTKVPMHRLIVQAWQAAGKDEKVQAHTKYRASGGKLTLPYKLDPNGGRGALKPVVLGGTEKGYLVLTGQPGQMDTSPDKDSHRKHNKHLEFVFDAKVLRTLEVDAEVIRRFREIYAQSPDLAYLESASSPHRLRGIPVFFMAETSRDRSKPPKVTSLGLSRLYRLPGKRTLGEIIRRQQTQRLMGKQALDFVETLMGHIEVDGAEGSARSRLSVGDCRWHGTPGSQPRLAEERFQQETVLAQPKPSFYPSYLVQPNVRNEHKTILSDDAKLRGWKRYPVRPLSEVTLNPVAIPGSDANVRLRPLREGSAFKGQIRLHNVMPEELGAVVWALTWGGNGQLRHALGMGKPFGLGQVSIKVQPVHAQALRSNDPSREPPSLQTCVKAFEAYMEQQVKGWAGSEAMTELLAMANPSLPQANRANLTPLRLQVPGTNEFSQAKGDDNPLMLRPYSQQGAPAGR